MHFALAAARALARHRLAQFALIGGALFAIAPAAESGREIVVAGDRVRALAAADASRSGAVRESDDKAHAIQTRAIEDELLYREGVRLGLAEDDAIVRQRVIQKVLFLAEELDGATKPPSREELERFYRDHATALEDKPRLRLRQIFAHRKETLADGPERARGEPGPMPQELDATEDEIAQKLGSEAVIALGSLAPGAWSAPIASPYGFHLLSIVGRTPGRVPPLDEVKPRVLELYSVARREEAVAKFLQKAFKRYRVVVDGAPLTTIEPDKRVAFRADPSGED